MKKLKEFLKGLGIVTAIVALYLALRKKEKVTQEIEAQKEEVEAANLTVDSAQESVKEKEQAVVDALETTKKAVEKVKAKKEVRDETAKSFFPDL